jgi:gliding motility-associated-like protein
MLNLKRKFIFFLTLAAIFEASAQQSKDGAKTIVAANTIINEYTFLASDALSGVNTITVADASFNAYSRFSSALSAGDLLLIIQMQGASLTTANDSTWGSISSYNNAGLYEFVEVASVSGNTVFSSCPLRNSYTASGKVQVVRVPRYSTLTVNAGTSVIASSWDGTTGGIVVAESAGDIVVNGTIDVSIAGFRGGALDNDAGGGFLGFASTDPIDGAEKGEGIAGYQNDYNPYGGRYGRGAPANGGGGGNSHNSAGGGGGNAGALPYTGNGNPDITTDASWIAAWETEYNGFSNSTSSGGGRGGCSLNEKDADALQYGPGDWYHWRGDGRQNVGGKGGRPLNYTDRIFMGGGGGAGDANQNEGGRGGNGGGLVFFLSCGQIKGAASGKIIANGEAAPDIIATGSGDAVGGGGAGGTIILNAKGGVSGISLIANGGKGADHTIQGPVGYGPGGGGGGGYIAITSGSISRSAKGGVNGVTTSSSFTEFPPNSATIGGKGIDNAIFSQTNVLLARDTSICPGNSVTLSASYKGAVNWYKTASRNSFISSGPTFTTGKLFTDTVFYVGACFSYCTTPLIPVHVKVSGGSAGKLAGRDSSVCSGSPVKLGEAAQNNYSYQWSPSQKISDTTSAQPIFSAINNTTSPLSYIYYLTADLNGCKSVDSVVVVVNPEPKANAGKDTSVCGALNTQLGWSGNSNFTYQWTPSQYLDNPNAANPFVHIQNTSSEKENHVYNLIVTANGCSISSMVHFSIYPKIKSMEDTVVCFGQNITLKATGGEEYLWSTGETSPSINIIADSTKTYYVNIDGVCKFTDSVKVLLKNENRNAFYIPNAFTPNGDGLNDVFKVKGEATQFQASIFNRWGEEIYSWSDPEGGWDGNVKGSVVQNDVYVYRVNTKQECGGYRYYMGSITVIK